MRLNLVFVGKTFFPDLEAGIERYLSRLQHYVPTRVFIVKAEKVISSSHGGNEAVLEKEGNRIAKLIGREDYVVAWEKGGKELDSVGFARFLEKVRENGANTVWMIVGGPLGLSEKLVASADTVLSLSRMTFPHDLARLMIAEQLYRAFTILKGEPYHK